jgi:hypothetical protein
MPPSGGATIGDQLRAKGSPVLQALAQHTDTAIKKNPTLASKPGGLWQALISGTMGAIGGLGDASAVGTVPSGGGALEGLTRTLAARNQRLTAQKQQQFQNQQEADKNKVLNAEANARMVHEQQLTHNLKEEGTIASLKSGQEQLAAWKNQPNPGIERAKGLTADQAKDMLKKDGLDPTEETLVPSGVITTVDKDGQPYNQLTYSVVRVTPVDLDPKDKDQKAVLDRINKYAPPEPGKTWEGENSKPIHFSGAQYNMLLQMSNERQAADIAAQKVAAQFGFAQEDVKKDEEALKFRQDPNIIKALGQASNVNGVPDFISARNALLQASQDPKSPLYGKYNNVDNDMREYLGYTQTKGGEKSYLYDKMLDDYQKKVDSGMELITNLQKEVDKAHGEDAAGLAATLQAKIADPNTPAALKPRYQRMLDQANASAKASLDYDVDKKSRETDAEMNANKGDLSSLMDMALNYETDPDKLFPRFKSAKEKLAFEAEMHRRDPSWSFGEYQSRYKTAEDFRPEGKGGIAKQSLNAFGGHIGDANNLISSLGNTKSPLLNTPLNKIKEDVLGQPQFIQYRTAVAAAADEYINFLLNQKAKHASDDDLAARLQSTNTSPAQAQAMMRQMANTIAIRARAMNKAYRDQMGGKDIPNFMDPDTSKVLRDFGINPNSITAQGESGLVNSPTPPPPPNATTAIKDAQGKIIGYR